MIRFYKLNLDDYQISEIELVNMTVKELSHYIDVIESYDRTDSYFAYTYIKNLLNAISIPAPKVTVKLGTKYIRGRVHPINKEFFNNVREISYRRDKFQIDSFGRSNEPCQSIFYCSTHQKTAIIETCTITREERDKDNELITWGIWEVIKPFDITYVISHQNSSKANLLHEHLSQKFIDYTDSLDPIIKAKLILLHDYLSKKFKIKASGHAALYKVSAAYSNYVFDEEFADSNDPEKKLKKIEGILYASSLWPDEGMNLALTPNIVDNHLKLIDVRRDRIVRKGDIYDGTDTVSAKSIDLKNGTFEW